MAKGEIALFEQFLLPHNVFKRWEKFNAAQAYSDRHFSPPVDFLFQESLLYTPETEYVGLDESVRIAQADLP